MITIVCRWDTAQMDSELEWRMWRQIKGAFSPNPSEIEFVFVPVSPGLASARLRQFDTMDEALASVPPTASRVFLEPTGEKTISEIPQGDVALILGNTKYGNIDKAKPGETYRIPTPGATHLYGINAAAIALAARLDQ